MQTILEALRGILGEASFYDPVTQVVDYNSMIEYVIGGILLLTVVSCVFKLLFKLFGGSR